MLKLDDKRLSTSHKNMTSSTGEKLKEIVSQEIILNPYEYEGLIWCKLAQPELAEKLGVTTRTIRRLISRPPFARYSKQIDGKKFTLVRIGEPLPPKTNHGANILAKIWSTYISKVKSDWEIEKKEKLAKAKGLEEADSQKTSKEIKDKDWNLAKRTIKPNRREYGCLCGLWELWPDGQQAKIFKKVLKEWHIFCAGMFWQQSFDEVEGEQAEKRFFHYPSITVIRRYHMVALEMIEIETQDKGKNPLPWLKAKNPSLWKHLDKKGDQKGGSKPETPVEESVSGGSGDGDMSESS